MTQSAGYVNASQASCVSPSWNTELTGKPEFLANEFVDTGRLIDNFFLKKHTLTATLVVCERAGELILPLALVCFK